MIKLFIDLDGTVAKFNVKNALKRFDNEIGFFAKLGAYKNIEVVNKLAKSGQVFVITASPNEQADKDKIIWLNKFLPNISIENITICRIGQDKAKVIQEKYNISIDKECYLLDDYTKNLQDWTKANGIGIKRLTSIADNSRKIWQGLQIKDLKELAEIVGLNG